MDKRKRTPSGGKRRGAGRKKSVPAPPVTVQQVIASALQNIEVDALPPRLRAIYDSPDFAVRLAREYAEDRAFTGQSLENQLQEILDRPTRSPQSPTAIP